MQQLVYNSDRWLSRFDTWAPLPHRKRRATVETVHFAIIRIVGIKLLANLSIFSMTSSMTETARYFLYAGNWCTQIIYIFNGALLPDGKCAFETTWEVTREFFNGCLSGSSLLFFSLPLPPCSFFLQRRRSVLDLSEAHSRERAWTNERLVCAPIDRANLFIRSTIEVAAF